MTLKHSHADVYSYTSLRIYTCCLSKPQMNYSIRDEQPQDVSTIATLTTLAFKDQTYSDGNEAAIVDGLRKSRQLTLSLVAESGSKIIGHIAFSPVTTNGERRDWYGLGPVSVSPERQKQGIGSALVREPLKRMTELGGKGCVLLGDPGFYQRFGFKLCPSLRCDAGPQEYFMALPLNSAMVPHGKADFHESFSVA